MGTAQVEERVLRYRNDRANPTTGPRKKKKLVGGKSDGNTAETRVEATEARPPKRPTSSNPESHSSSASTFGNWRVLVETQADLHLRAQPKPVWTLLLFLYPRCAPWGINTDAPPLQFPVPCSSGFDAALLCASTARSRGARGGARELRVRGQEGRRARKGHPDAPHLTPPHPELHLATSPSIHVTGPAGPTGSLPLFASLLLLVDFCPR